VPILFLCAILLAGFIAAGMMILAFFARTFREGQAMITPFYMLILVPVVFLQVPGLALSPLTALLPVLNITLMAREAITGTLHAVPLAITLAVMSIVIVACLRIARFIMGFEDVLVGSYGGSFAKFVKERLLKKKFNP
jgi:sodium transport system permease protein